MNQVRELRAVLIGGRELGGIEASGKSSVGNVILGRDVFPTGRRTGRCQKAEGEVHGFNVTLVDTPGWWWHYSLENTPTFDKLEIKQSMSLCPPGPHVFLLILPVDSVFPAIYKLALIEQLEVFGKDVWKHVFVVFSSITLPDKQSFEKHIKTWPDLSWLLRKCKNRYHVLDIKNQRNNSQVYTLLSKIAKMVTNENGHYYETDTQLGETLNERRTRYKEKAHQRMTAVQRQRDELRTRILSGVHHQSDIRLVIVGASWAGRSSAGNVILGKAAFGVDNSRTTVQCEVRSSEIHGRNVTVVDTPGWFYSSPLKETSETDKLEIKRSVTLCPPGPHAILLTVPIATAFNKAYKEAVEQHMDLLGEGVWSHTVVLFTRGDWLGDTTIEERIETDEPHLKWLMNKCGNRYHVLTCTNQSDFTQSVELFEKIDDMIAGNNGGHYKTEASLSDKLHEMLMTVQSRARTYRIKTRRQRNILQKVFNGENYQLSELRIVLLGKEKSGKSSSGNTILCGSFFQTTALEGFKTQSPTKQCTIHKREIAGCPILVVDTPGWSATSLEDTEHIWNSVSLCPPGPLAFLLVLSVKETFKSEDQQALEELMKHFGEKVWKHTLLLFSHGDWLKDKPIEEYIECEGDALKWLLNKCESRYHLLQNFDWGDGSQVKHLLQKIKEMVVRNKGQPYNTEKKGTSIRELFVRPKTLTEVEWNKREDELIQMMLEAFWMESDAENSIVMDPKASGSLDGAYVPSMSEETMSEGDICKPIKPLVKVSKWLSAAQQWHDGSSSGYGTESIAMSCNEIKEAVWMNFTAESPQHKGSYDIHHVPDMSEEAKWDAESFVTTGSQTNASKWLKSEEKQHDTSSSGYETESRTMSYNRIDKVSQLEQNQEVGAFGSTKEKPNTGQMSFELKKTFISQNIRNQRRNSF